MVKIKIKDLLKIKKIMACSGFENTCTLKRNHEQIYIIRQLEDTVIILSQLTIWN